MTPSRRRREALTLVEVLLTVALIGLVSTLLLRNLSEPDPTREELRALARSVRELDARARLAAKTGAAVSLAHDRSNQCLVVHARQGGGILAERKLPKEVEFTLRRDGAAPAHSIQYDPFGASCDYVVDLNGRAGHVRLEIAGTTGWVIETESRQ